MELEFFHEVIGPSCFIFTHQGFAKFFRYAACTWNRPSGTILSWDTTFSRVIDWTFVLFNCFIFRWCFEIFCHSFARNNTIKFSFFFGIGALCGLEFLFIYFLYCFWQYFKRSIPFYWGFFFFHFFLFTLFSFRRLLFCLSFCWFSLFCCRFICFHSFDFWELFFSRFIFALKFFLLFTLRSSFWRFNLCCYHFAWFLFLLWRFFFFSGTLCSSFYSRRFFLIFSKRTSSSSFYCWRFCLLSFNCTFSSSSCRRLDLFFFSSTLYSSFFRRFYWCFFINLFLGSISFISSVFDIWFSKHFSERLADIQECTLQLLTCLSGIKITLFL